MYCLVSRNDTGFGISHGSSCYFFVGGGSFQPAILVVGTDNSQEKAHVQKIQTTYVNENKHELQCCS